VLHRLVEPAILIRSRLHLVENLAQDGLNRDVLTSTSNGLGTEMLVRVQSSLMSPRNTNRNVGSRGGRKSSREANAAQAALDGLSLRHFLSKEHQ
jgi:hypothetical protein